MSMMVEAPKSEDDRGLAGCRVIGGPFCFLDHEYF